jgi:hypothetical protein
MPEEIGVGFAWRASLHPAFPDSTDVDRRNLLYRAISKRAEAAPVSPNDSRVARAEGYREIAEGLRELARRSRFREIKKELYDWAYRCDRIADKLKSQRPTAKSRIR